MQFSFSPRLITLCLALCLSVAFLVPVIYPSPLPRHSPELAEGRTRVPPAQSKNSVDCTTKIEQREVRGDSLSPFIHSGQTIQLLYGYYKCHNVERGDLVAYAYSGDPMPILKIVKGVAGDRFELRKTNHDCWNLLINGLIVQNSEGREYCFDEKRHTMLSLYARDYHGLIPPHAYLILGNLVQGTLDSTRFGLADKSGLIGKAVKVGK